jgi:hypothetical protein
MIAITTMCLIGWGMLAPPAVLILVVIAMATCPTWEIFWKNIEVFFAGILIIGIAVAWFMFSFYLISQCK